jgi:penicillin-binding protein 2
MACAYAGLATRGTEYRPHVLKGIRARTGTGSVIDYDPQVMREVVEDNAYLDLVHSGLVGVIYEEEAWIAMHFETLPVTVAGKSGTGERAGHNPTAWFIAFAPADNPRYVVASTIEDATWANSSALYLTRDVLGAIYNAPDDLPMSVTSIEEVAD